MLWVLSLLFSHTLFVDLVRVVDTRLLRLEISASRLSVIVDSRYMN